MSSELLYQLGLARRQQANPFPTHPPATHPPEEHIGPLEQSDALRFAQRYDHALYSFAVLTFYQLIGFVVVGETQEEFERAKGALSLNMTQTLGHTSSGNTSYTIYRCRAKEAPLDEPRNNKIFYSLFYLLNFFT
jgi:hypothetical protein